MHTNQKLLVDAIIKKGGEIRLIDEADELLEISFNNKKEFLLDRFSSQMPFHVVKITADKFLTKKILLANGISTPEGKIFTGNSYGEALLYAKKKFPLVLKPNWGSNGNFVQVNIRSMDELKTAIDFFTDNVGFDTPFILEHFYPWKEYRLFITSFGDFAVIHRDWASVVGDGITSIINLIEKENNFRLSLKKESNTSLCPIIVDDEVTRYLFLNGLNLNSIPKLNEKIYLRQESNLAKGGMAINYTKKMPIFFKNLSSQILSLFPGMKVAGLDLLCPNIYSNNPEFVILEVNSNPGLSMHHYPTCNNPEPVADYMLDIMFPNFFNI